VSLDNPSLYQSSQSIENRLPTDVPKESFQEGRMNELERELAQMKNRVLMLEQKLASINTKITGSGNISSLL
jgi:uncharacterized coiled-coil protein SlyX